MKKNDHREQIIVLTDIITVLAESSGNQGKYAVFEERVPPLGGPPPHTHPDEEVFYIIEGVFEFILNDISNTFKAHSGSVVHVPSGALHTFKNIGDKEGLMVVLLSPGNLLNYFRKIGTQVMNGNILPDMNKVPKMEELDIERAFRYASEYGIEFVMPEIIKTKPL